MVCFLLFSEKKIFLLLVSQRRKKTETKPPSSWGHELTFAHFNVLLIPTWFLLFDGLSLLKLGKINSVRLYQVGRAGGKQVPLIILLVEPEHPAGSIRNPTGEAPSPHWGKVRNSPPQNLGTSHSQPLQSSLCTQNPSDLTHRSSLFRVRLRNPRII